MDARLIIDRHIEAVLGREMRFPADYCATFAAACVLEIHGRDILGNRFAGAFAESEEEAYRSNPMGLLVTTARRMRELGWRRVPATAAKPGDVAVTRSNGYGHGIAVARGDGWFIRRNGRGVRFELAETAVAVWTPPEAE